MTLAASAVPAVVNRRAKVRRVFRESATATAAELIGPLADGDELTGLTNGQFSLIDMIEHVLTQTGPADICVATWTMGIYDVERAYEFVRNGALRRVRFVLDPSMFSRRPEIAKILVRGFGVDAFRGVNTHAKFATIRGAALAVCIRSSMNLNPNKRIESFDLSVCSETTAFFETAVDRMFAAVDADNRSQSHAVFAQILEAQAPRPSRRANPFSLAAT